VRRAKPVTNSARHHLDEDGGLEKGWNYHELGRMYDENT
jgi:hypothetical protein